MVIFWHVTKVENCTMVLLNRFPSFLMALSTSFAWSTLVINKRARKFLDLSWLRHSSNRNLRENTLYASEGPLRHICLFDSFLTFFDGPLNLGRKLHSRETSLSMDHLDQFGLSAGRIYISRTFKELQIFYYCWTPLVWIWINKRSYVALIRGTYKFRRKLTSFEHLN